MGEGPARLRREPLRTRGRGGCTRSGSGAGSCAGLDPAPDPVLDPAPDPVLVQPPQDPDCAGSRPRGVLLAGSSSSSRPSRFSLSFRFSMSWLRNSEGICPGRRCHTLDPVTIRNPKNIAIPRFTPPATVDRGAYRHIPRGGLCLRLQELLELLELLGLEIGSRQLLQVHVARPEPVAIKFFLCENFALVHELCLQSLSSGSE